VLDPITPFDPWSIGLASVNYRRIAFMNQTVFTNQIEIPASAEEIWSVLVDVERWPEWTPSISKVKKLSPVPLAVGNRVRIHQPKFPPAWWRVTDLEPGYGFTWESVAPGLHVIAQHCIEPTVTGSRVTLSISYEGRFGRWLAGRTRALNERYLAMEANGLKSRCLEIERNGVNGRVPTFLLNAGNPHLIAKPA
jgi:hypothetical protein